MSIHPDIEKWKGRFFVCLLLATGALFLTGAREVTLDLRHRQGQRQSVSADLRDTGWAILSEDLACQGLPDALAPSCARFLVKACCRPAVSPHDHEREGP